VDVWDVLQQRTEGDELVLVGSINAPSLDVAMLLARETHFRHGEGVNYGIRRRGDTNGRVHVCPDPTGIGGVVDRSYRRQDGYVGVGAKLKRVREQLAARGVVIDRPRPAVRGRGEDA
jgi:1,2-phenylacetyl-CoA epoxidase PaaB subunit